MKIWEFVKELAIFFPLTGTEEHQNKIFDSYVENLEGIAITNHCDYDWKKVLQTIQRTYTYSKFPPLADIIKVLPECKIYKPYIECADEGDLIVVTLPNGMIYTFTVCASGRNIDTISEELKFKFGTFEMKQYPKGTVMIGKEIVLP